MPVSLGQSVEDLVSSGSNLYYVLGCYLSVCSLEESTEKSE